MNRMEFMSRLEQLLQEISESEREAAMTYYRDYFEDAGVENEQEVIDALGSPERVADTIKAGLGGKVIDGEYTETGYKQEPGEHREETALSKGGSEAKQTRGKKDYSKQRPNENTLLKVILYVLLAVLLSPVWMPLAGALCGIVVAVAAIILTIALLVLLLPAIAVITGAAVAVSGLLVFIVGLFKLVVAPAAAIGFIGIGLLLAGGGILAGVLGILILVKLIPPMIRGFVNLCKKPFTKKRRDAS